MAADRRVERFDLFFIGEAGTLPDFESIRRETGGRWNKVFVEDIEAIERPQLSHRP